MLANRIRPLLVLALLLGFATNLPAADPNAQERLEIARKTWEEMIVRAYDLMVAPPAAPEAGSESFLKEFLNGEQAEKFRLWSCRWSEAQADLGGKPADRVAALAGHLERMQALEQGKLKLESNRLKDLDEYGPAMERINGLFRGFRDLSDEDRRQMAVYNDPGAREFFAIVRFSRLEAESWHSKAKSAESH